jgi:hypothetical protein
MRLVEDVGEPLSAGWLSRVVRTTGLDEGAACVGERDVSWALEDGAMRVTHAPAKDTDPPASYVIRLRYTKMPSGGARWWWSCPACRARVDALYLPPDRDRLACRKFCGLVYRSQYTGKKRRRRGPKAVVKVTWECREWTAATGWVMLSRRTVRR